VLIVVVVIMLVIGILVMHISHQNSIIMMLVHELRRINDGTDYFLRDINML
jgi:hypothetical protein